MKSILAAILTGVLAFCAGANGAEPRPNMVLAPHAHDLVVLEGNKLVPFESTEFLRARYTVLYFGAGWCPDCRRFSPALVEAYDKQPISANRFEVLLISHDKNAEGMLNFMRVEKMKWPALAFDEVAGAEDLHKLYSGHGIPCLTVIDSSGHVVLQSKSDQDARDVLQQFEQLLMAPAKK